MDSDLTKFLPALSFDGVQNFRRLTNGELLARYSFVRFLDNNFTPHTDGVNWLIKRIIIASDGSQSVVYANVNNNPTVTTLETAINDRLSLLYESILDITL